MKQKEGAEEPEGLLDQILAKDVAKEVVERFHQPFDKVLQPGGHHLDLPGGHLRQQDQAQRHRPRDHHRAGELERANGKHDRCRRRQAVVFPMFRTLVGGCGHFAMLRRETGHRKPDPHHGGQNRFEQTHV
jgi:hypothetical protein